MQILSDAHFYFLLFMALLLGASIGSFLNVCILRIPRKISLSIPGSHCFNCGTALGLGENIPIVGYFILKGKCKHCASTFSFQYAWVEILTGLFSVLFFICSIRSPISFDPIAWALQLTFFSVLLVAALIDLKWEIIPDQITLPFAALFIIAHFLAPNSFLPRIIDAHNFENQPIFFITLILIFIFYFVFSQLEQNRSYINFVNLIILLFLFSAAIYYGIYKKDQSQEYQTAFYSLVGTVFTGGVLYLILIFFKFTVKKDILGEGDIKLMFVIGAFLGGVSSYKVLIVWLYLAAAFTSVLVYFQILKHKINSSEKYVSGVFLLLMLVGLAIVSYVQIYNFNSAAFIIGVSLFLVGCFSYFLFAKKWSDQKIASLGFPMAPFIGIAALLYMFYMGNLFGKLNLIRIWF